MRYISSLKKQGTLCDYIHAQLAMSRLRKIDSKKPLFHHLPIACHQNNIKAYRMTSSTQLFGFSGSQITDLVHFSHIHGAGAVLSPVVLKSHRAHLNTSL